jgi:hypothetical protein
VALERKQKWRPDFPFGLRRRRIFCRLLRHPIENKRHMSTEMSGTGHFSPKFQPARNSAALFIQTADTRADPHFFVLIAGEKKMVETRCLSHEVGSGSSDDRHKNGEFFLNFLR